MQRQGAFGAERLQHCEARASRDHVILGVNLEPQAGRRTGHRLFEMNGLEAYAGGRTHGGQPFCGMSEPMPFGVLIEAQEPASTYFQASP